MSFQAMTWAALQPCKNAAQKLVLLMLANRANGHTGQCNPSHSRLAQECCMSVSSLKVQIKALEHAGYSHIIRKTKDGVNQPNQYALNIAVGGSESEGVDQNLPEGGSESGYKPVIKPINTIITDNENFLTFDGLPPDQIECYHWAKNHAWHKALKRAEIENFRWHDLRHTWASWHIQNGTPLHALQELGGWSESDMVQRYAHLSPLHLSAYANNVSVETETEGTNWLHSQKSPVAKIACRA